MPARKARLRAPVTVRDARAADLPALSRMGAALTRAHHAMDPARFFLPDEPVEAGYAWWLGKELVNPRAVILVAVRGRARRRRALPADGARAKPEQSVLGYAYGRIERRDWNTLRERCAVGVDLWIEPAARRSGAGRALVEALCARFAARGEPRLVIQAAAANGVARRIFEGMGFRETVVELARELTKPSLPSGRLASLTVKRERARERQLRGT